MENKEKNAKAKETLGNIWQKTQDVSKKAAGEISKGAKMISEKAKKDAYERRMKKYNPLFWEEFSSSEFKIPNIIKIVDEVIRKDIDVCEGAMGWIAVENDNGVLYLYDEFVEQSNIEFLPTPDCNQIYYMDRFNRNRFIQVDCIFERAHNEKIAELEQISYSLGAKSCLIEISESDRSKYAKNTQNSTAKSSDRSAQIKDNSFGSKENISVESSEEVFGESSSSRSGTARTYFEGSRDPIHPDLKWFRNDENILGLIKMRCSGSNGIISRKLTLSGSTSATMSHSTALTIDVLLEESVNVKKVKANNRDSFKRSATMIKKAENESNRLLIFDHRMIFHDKSILTRLKI